MSLVRIRTICRFGIAFLAAMIILELFCRWSGASRPVRMTHDDDLGLKWKPNIDIVAIAEGFRLGRINEHGYFGPPYPPDKPEEAIRIALIGDSFVAGLWIADRHHFRSLLEDRLEAELRRPVQVMNFGFEAANFERMYVIDRILAQKFNPDYVLYFLSTASLNREKIITGPRIIAQGDSLGIDYSFRSGEEYAVLKKFSFRRELGLHKLFQKTAWHYSGEGAPRQLMSKFFGKFASLYYRLFWPYPEARNDDAMGLEKPGRKALNRDILKELARLNGRSGSQYVVVRRDILPPDFVELVLAGGITYLDPSDDFEELSESGIDPCYWKGSQLRGHWNHHGHQVIGKFLAREMQALIQED